MARTRSSRLTRRTVLTAGALAAGLGLGLGGALDQPDDVRLVGLHANLPRPDESMAEVRRAAPYRVREVLSLPADALLSATYVSQRTAATPNAFSVDLVYLAGDDRLHVWMTNIGDAELAADGKAPPPGERSPAGGGRWMSAGKDDHPRGGRVTMLWTRLDDGVLVSLTAPAGVDARVVDEALRSLAG